MAKPKAKPKVKPKSKKKAAPKNRATLENVLGEINKIHQRLDKVESDVRALRGVASPQTPQPEEENDTEIEVKFWSLTSL